MTSISADDRASKDCKSERFMDKSGFVLLTDTRRLWHFSLENEPYPNAYFELPSAI